MDQIERDSEKQGQVMEELIENLKLLCKDCKSNRQPMRLRMFLTLFVIIAYLKIISNHFFK